MKKINLKDTELNVYLEEKKTMKQKLQDNNNKISKLKKSKNLLTKGLEKQKRINESKTKENNELKNEIEKLEKSKIKLGGLPQLLKDNRALFDKNEEWLKLEGTEICHHRMNHRKMNRRKQNKVLDAKIESNINQYKVDRLNAEISAFSSGDLNKYEFLKRIDLNYKPNALEQAKFEFSPLGKTFSTGLNKTIPNYQKEGVIKLLKDIKNGLSNRINMQPKDT